MSNPGMPDPVDQHEIVGLRDVITSRELPCDFASQPQGCGVKAIYICWSCVAFYCLDHGLEHWEVNHL